MIYVPGESFPTGTDDSGTATIPSAYWIGETQVTYELWDKVYTWATANGYTFAHPGAMGGGAGPFTNQHPVTTINWRDAMVWTNAATEWYNAKNGTSYTPVYTYGGNVIRDSTDATACDSAVAGSTNGFRLLTSNEWELAARWRNDATNTVAVYNNPWFTKGDSASGATANYTNEAATSSVAVYNTASTAAVKSKTPNALGLYDMSGNVWEWCFDLSGPNRVSRGGAYYSDNTYVQVGYVYPNLPNYDDSTTHKMGLRLAQSE
jgi:formylglycine-generating enzyme required for sulfatase activity